MSAQRPPQVVLRVLRALLPPGRRDEIEGDLIELWNIHVAEGRRTVAYSMCRDAISLARLARRPPSSGAADRAVRSSLAQGVRNMWTDVGYALRLMRRRPRFAAAIVVTLAIGIGAATATFTVGDRVLLRPLPYPSPDRVVALSNIPFSFANGQMRVSPDVVKLSSFSAVGMWAAGGVNLGDPANRRIGAAAVTEPFFAALAVAPARGRIFHDSLDPAHSAVIGFDFWRDRLGQRDDVLGQNIVLNSRPFRIVGVMPRGFTFPGMTDVWIPAGSDSQITGAAFAPQVIARLSPGVNWPQAAAALNQFDAARRTRIPGYVPDAVVMTRLDELIGRRARPALMLLVGAVAFLLLTTCANVAGLMLSRISQRTRELAVRTALGATRARIGLQLAMECGVLAAIGGLTGVLLAAWAVHVVMATVTSFVPDVPPASIDGRFGVIASVVTMISALLFAAAPAAFGGARRLSQTVRDTSSIAPRGAWLRRTLAIGQIACALVLLTTTGTAFSTVARLSRVPLGFANDRAVTFEVTLPAARYSTSAAIAEVISRSLEQLRAIPGVTAAAATNVAPGTSGLAVGLNIWAADRPDPTPEHPEGRKTATLLVATPDYFAAMGIPILSGRAFEESDTTGPSRTIVLGKSTVSALWPDQAAVIGRHVRVRMFRDPALDLEVIGVVPDVRLHGVATPANPQMYLSLAQNSLFGGVAFAVSTASDPAQLPPMIQSALERVDAGLPAYNLHLVRDVRAAFLQGERLTLALAGGFAVVASALGAFGLYGVLSLLVAQRTREIGVRMALGANATRVRVQFVGTGLWLGAIGVAGGLALSSGMTRILARFVPSADAPSAVTIAGEAALLLAVVAAAAWFPARRASAVDPLIALRSE